MDMDGIRSSRGVVKKQRHNRNMGFNSDEMG